jgi:hypothetical protein
MIKLETLALHLADGGREHGTWQTTRALLGRAEALAGILKRSWRLQTGRRTWQTMQALLGRAEALAGTLNAQDVANTLWRAGRRRWRARSTRRTWQARCGRRVWLPFFAFLGK